MRRSRNVLLVLALPIVSLGALEVLARLLLLLFPALGDPWSGGVGARLNAELVRHMENDLSVVAQRQRLYLQDRTLFWRLAPDVHLEVANEVFEMRDQTPLRWTIRTDAEGFRGPLVAPAHAGMRILTLGDSCTFGFRVNDDQIYPARLAPACAAQVVDAGVPGYTTYQGKRLLRALLGAQHPDVVTIAFGANDREQDVLTDADRGAWLDRPLGRLTYACGHLGLYRLLSGLLARPAASKGPLHPRVDTAAYRANVEEMIDLAQDAGARVVLLDLVYIGPFYRDTLQELSSRRKVPLVDGRQVLDETFERITQGVAYRDEVQQWVDFYRAHVAAVRPVYLDAEFYRRRYATERQQQQFMTLMADPIHPNALGHRALADALVPIVCPQ